MPLIPSGGGEQGEEGRKETLRGAESNHFKISTILSSRRRVTSHPKRAQKFENSIPNLFVAGSVPELSLIVSWEDDTFALSVKN